jgi:hypothetical protein
MFNSLFQVTMKSSRSPVTGFYFSLATLSTSGQTSKITAAEAKNHVGETRTACGKVANTHYGTSLTRFA